MIEVHTSLLTTPHYCAQALAERFTFVAVYYGDIPEPARTTRLQTLAQELYRQNQGRVLSLAKDAREHQRYVLMLSKGDSLTLTDRSLASYPMEGARFPASWLIRTLLVRALPRILTANTRDWFESDGLFYITAIKSIPGHQGAEVVTTEVSPQPIKGARGHYLALKTVTFTPFSLHRHEDGTPYKKAIKKPRYRLNVAGQSLSKCGDGDYVRLARFPARRNRTQALHARPGQLEQFYKSRVGVLTQFLEDFQRAYGELANIGLQKLNAVQIKIRDKDVHQAYREIYRLLASQRIYLVNRSDDPLAAEALSAELKQLDLNGIHAGDIMPDGLNLLIVNEAAEYEQQQHRDPYRLARQRYPHAVIQSCTPQRLQGNARAHVVEVLLKELLIKQEVKDGCLRFGYPDMPADLVFILPIRPEEPEQGLAPDADWPWACARLAENRMTFWWADPALQQDVRLSLDAQQQRALFSGYDRPSLVFNPDNKEVMLITDTQAVTLPDHATLHRYLHEIEHSLQQPVPAQLLETCLSVKGDMPEELRSRLQQLIHQARQEALPASRLLAALNYKKKSEQAVYDFLAEHGYRLKASLAADGGVLNATIGIWVDHDRQLYFAGAKGSAQSIQSNFGHIYHLENGYAGIPDWYLASLEVYHVRHKNPTVMPFIFKHLREYAQAHPLA